MSLKAFHIIFVTVSTILCVGVGAWGIRRYQLEGGAGPLVFAIVCFLCAAGLIVYGRWFLRKLKGVSFV